VIRTLSVLGLLFSPGIAAAAAPELVFYPPLGVADATITQPFDPLAEPVVQLLAVDEAGNTTALASYSLTIGYGNDFLALDAVDEQFTVTIHAADVLGFDPAGTYAIDVSSAGVSVGRVGFAFADPTLLLVAGDTSSQISLAALDQMRIVSARLQTLQDEVLPTLPPAVHATHGRR
jgi:hypothetical protein